MKWQDLSDDDLCDYIAKQLSQNVPEEARKIAARTIVSRREEFADSIDEILGYMNKHPETSDPTYGPRGPQSPLEDK